MLSEQSHAPKIQSDELTLEDRTEAALLAHHVVDPRGIEEVDRMRREVRALAKKGGGDFAQRLTNLCIDYIREGQSNQE